MNKVSPFLNMPSLELLRVHEFPGYLPGRTQPSMGVEFAFPQGGIADQVRATEALKDVLMETVIDWDAVPDLPPELEESPFLACVVRAALAVLRKAGMPLFDPVSLARPYRQGGSSVEILFPTLQEAHATVVWALMVPLEAWEVLKGIKSRADWEARLDTILLNIEEQAPKGINGLGFLEAANKLGIPWFKVVGAMYQFGWGTKARWFNNSFTDKTPRMSAVLARNKLAAATMLRRAGLPVPDHRQVHSADEAVAVAEELGYPVVVKVFNKDGGIGVVAHITGAEAVRNAYDKVSQISKSVLVEQFIVGNDYRLQVMNGEVYWVSHRMPAGVTGNGQDTVEQLVAIENTNPLRGPAGSTFPMKTIVLEEEAEDWLQRQGMTANSVPAEGQYVRLRGAANIASGGMITPALELAHPDNLALAVRAARIMRLDIAGVDLLIPDISVSWKECIAAICEINSQPQLAPTLPEKVVRAMVEGQGRIPVILVIGSLHDEPWLADLVSALSPACVGVSDESGLWLAGQRIVEGQQGLFRAGEILLSDPATDACILQVVDAGFVQTGLPVDRFDLLVLTGPALDNVGNANWSQSHGMAAALVPAAQRILISEESQQWLAKQNELDMAKIITCQRKDMALKTIELLPGKPS